MSARRSQMWLALALATLGCSERVSGPDPAPPPSSSRAVVLDWEHPLPQGNDLTDIWGFDDGAKVAVGERGTVLRFDGATWTAEFLDPAWDFEGVWGESMDTLYAAGSSGLVAYYDGSQWRRLDAGTTERLWDIHGSAPDNIWVVGDGGEIRQWDGATWVDRSIPTVLRFRCVWAYAPDDVYVGGTSDHMFHFDGTGWAPGPESLRAVEFVDLAGTGPGSIACFTDEGRAEAFVGLDRTWITSLLFGGEVGAIWAFDSNNWVAVSRDYALHVVNGVGDGFVTTGSRELLAGVWASSMQDITAVGRAGKITYYNGVAWQPLERAPRAQLNDLALSPDGSILAAGFGTSTHPGNGWEGTILRRPPGGGLWEDIGVGLGYDLAGIWVGPSVTVTVGRFANDPYRGADWHGAILRDAGAGWIDESREDVQRFFGVWGSSDTDIYAVGWAGLILHHDGSAWAVSDSGRASWLSAVDGRGPADVYAVGARLSLPGGVVYHFDGFGWSLTELGQIEQCLDLYPSPSGEVFVACDAGRVMRLSDGAWKVLQTPLTVDLHTITGRSASDVYAAGSDGALLHFDGNRWERLVANTRRTLRAAAVLENGALLLAGDKGAVLRLTDI